MTLVKLIVSMITDKSLITFEINDKATRAFNITDGLQQGTINSPLLFNIYTADLLKLFGPQNTGCSLLAFADDLIVYIAHRKPMEIKSVHKKRLIKYLIIITLGN